MKITELASENSVLLFQCHFPYGGLPAKILPAFMFYHIEIFHRVAVFEERKPVSRTKLALGHQNLVVK